MNKLDENNDDYRSFLLLDEISKNSELTQRDLSKRLGVALGLVNSYIKNLASKGYITISTIPKKRYKYLLTPTGFAEKTRLTYHHLQNFTNLYRVARRDFSSLFRQIEKSQLKRLVFCGADEVAEIAYLSLKETGLELVGVVDNEKSGKRFFGYNILPAVNIRGMDYDIIIIASFGSGDRLKETLLKEGVREEKICDISGEGWLKKLEK